MTHRPAFAVVAAAGLLVFARLSSADTTFPSREVRIRVDLGDDGIAAVREEYALTSAMDSAGFQFLDDPCTTVGPVFAAIDDREIAFSAAPERATPWRFLNADVSGTPNGPGRLIVRYEVRARGSEVVVPIVMPAATLDLAEGARGARVTIAVRWTGARGAVRVAMPRLESTSADEWGGLLLAMPSSVRVDVAQTTGGGTCDRATTGATGGLEWRFAILVGTMVIWVPGYLLWFGRRWRANS